jgi:type IV secretory pathway VirJ component
MCDLRLSVRRSYTPSSENEFVDVETFSDDVLKVEEAPTGSVAAADAEADPSQASALKDGASPKFNEDLERTVQRSANSVENLPLVETREELLECQDPSPSVAT